MIHQAVVAGRAVGALGGELGVREETKLAEAVVHAHHDRTHFASDQVARRAAVRLQALAKGEPSAVNPHHDRNARAQGRRVDVEIEAILARHEAGDGKARKRELRADVGLLGRRKRVGPWLRVDRRLPTKLVDRWRGVRDAAVREYAVVLVTLRRAERGFHSDTAVVWAIVDTDLFDLRCGAGTQKCREHGAAKNRTSDHRKPLKPRLYSRSRAGSALSDLGQPAKTARSLAQFRRASMRSAMVTESGFVISISSAMNSVERSSW